MLLLLKVIGNIGLVVRCVGLSFLKEEICVYDSLEGPPFDPGIF
jgi:hypothetical protein